MTESAPELDDFQVRVGPYRAELHAYCYRMLGSLHDADDALQEALLGAWRGLSGFEGRSSLRSWLYRVATNACLQLSARRPRRLLPLEYATAGQGVELDAMVNEPVWLEPYPTQGEASYELRESIELAFVAALQHLAPNQRAVLILRDVLGFEAAEVAQLLATSVPAVTSALQRARETVEQRVPAKSQQATLRELGEGAQRELVTAFIAAWAARDVPALLQLLTRDAKFSMPPIPTWFDGHAAIGRFFAERVFAEAWRLVPCEANGQLAFACYQGPEFRLGALNVVTLRDGAIAALTGFLDPAVHAHFSNLEPMSFRAPPTLSG